MEEFFKGNYIQDCHVYREVWEMGVGEALVCKREPKNASNWYTVAMKKEGTFALKAVAGVFAVLRWGDTQLQVWVSSTNTWNGVHYNSHRNVLIIPCRKNLLQKIFRAIIFRSHMWIRKLFNDINFPVYGMFNFTLHVCAEMFYIVNNDVLASVSAPSLDTTDDIHVEYSQTQHVKGGCLPLDKCSRGIIALIQSLWFHHSWWATFQDELK